MKPGDKLTYWRGGEGFPCEVMSVKYNVLVRITWPDNSHSDRWVYKTSLKKHTEPQKGDRPW